MKIATCPQCKANKYIVEGNLDADQRTRCNACDHKYRVAEHAGDADWVADTVADSGGLGALASQSSEDFQPPSRRPAESFSTERVDDFGNDDGFGSVDLSGSSFSQPSEGVDMKRIFNEHLRPVLNSVRGKFNQARAYVSRHVNSDVLQRTLARTRRRAGDLANSQAVVSVRRFVRTQPRTVKIIGLSLVGVVALSAGLYVALGNFELGRASPETIASLQSKVISDPKDADLRLELGHALFSSGKRDKALRSYGKALSLDADVVDSRLADNLVACFGTKTQKKAARLLANFKMNDAEEGLRKLLRHKQRWVRLDALRTLTKIGHRPTRGESVAFYMLDLKAANCTTRRRAVARLGNLGDKRAIGAIQAAHRRDEEETSWYESSCLGDTPKVVVSKLRRL